MPDKKMNITLSAMKVFQEKGIEHTKISDIVKGAGIAQGTFYLYFPTKLAVMPAIAKVMVEKMLNKLKNNINLTDPFNNQLKYLIKMIFDLTEEYREIFALIYAGLASSEYLVNWEDIYDEYYTEVGNIIANAQKDETIRKSINPKRYAVLLIGLIESAAEQSFLYDKQDNEAIIVKKQEVFDFALNSLTE